MFFEQDTPASTESSPLFNEIDLDQNGVLSKEVGDIRSNDEFALALTFRAQEFTLHYNNIAGTATSSSSKSEPGNEASALNPSMLDDVEIAWHEFDSNMDGSVSISEWNAIMFHEEPQAPQVDSASRECLCMNRCECFCHESIDPTPRSTKTDTT